MHEPKEWHIEQRDVDEVDDWQWFTVPITCLTCVVSASWTHLRSRTKMCIDTRHGRSPAISEGVAAKITSFGSKTPENHQNYGIYKACFFLISEIFQISSNLRHHISSTTHRIDLCLYILETEKPARQIISKWWTPKKCYFLLILVL